MAPELATRGISGTDQALMYALAGLARSGATRSDYVASTPAIVIDGIPAGPTSTWRVLVASLTIADSLNEVANTCTFTMQGARPRDGAPIVITYGSRHNVDRLFAGTIIRSTQTYAAGKPANVLYQVEGIDWTWLLNGHLVTARYYASSATVIAVDLLAKYAPPGFTSRIADGLPTVDEISFTATPLMDAIGQLAARIGGYGKCDYDKRVWLWVTLPPADLPPPAPLVPSHPTLSAVTYTRDLSQLVTRALVEGGGGQALARCRPGETRIPVDAIGWYAPTGGWIVSGPNRMTYTGVLASSDGTMTSAVGGATGNVSPASAPTIGTIAGAGLPGGTYKYAFTWVTTAGETLPSPVGTFNNAAAGGPPAALVAGAVAGAGLGVGTYQYAYTWTTASGETTASPLRAVTTGETAIPAPTAAPTLELLAGPGLGQGGGYGYAVTFVTAQGETTPGPAAGISTPATPQSYNISPPHPTATTGGNLAPGTYRLKTVWAADTATPPQYTTPLSANETSITLSAGQTNIQAGMSGSLTGEPYGMAWACRTLVNQTSPFYLIPPPTPDNFGGSRPISIGHLSDAQLTSNPTASPSVNTFAKGRVQIRNVPIGPAGTTARRIYRTSLNGGDYRLVATIADNTTTAPAVDAMPDNNRGVQAPTSNTTSTFTARVALSGIATGPTGTTGRKVYRSAVNGTALKLVTTLANNTATTYTDAAADSALGAAPPTSGSAILTQATLGAILVGAPLVTARKVYRTAVNGSALKLYATLANNTATTIPTGDTTPDASLGAAVPTTDTSGLTSGPVGGQINAGATAIPVANVAPFAPEGWAQIGTQFIRYTGVSATHLTGIPSSGVGSLTISVPYDTVIAVPSQILGIPVTGPPAVNQPILAGDLINVLAIVNDLPAQARLRDVVGGDGILEGYAADGRLSLVEATARAHATLDLRGTVRETVRYRVRDPVTQSGATVTVDLPAPTSVAGTFQIQDVTIGSFVGTGPTRPVYDVTASSGRFSFEDLIRRRRDT